jgi:hypothetical protein
MTKVKTNFQPIVFAEQVHEKIVFEQEVKEQQEAIKKLKDFTAEKVSITDWDTIKDELYNNILNEFLNVHAEGFPKGSPVESIAQFMNFDLSRLKVLCNNANTNGHDIDLNTLEVLKTPCFDICTETEDQNKLLVYCYKVIESIENLQSTGRNLYIANLIGGLNGTIKFDFASNKLIPNEAFILGTER